MCTVCKKGYEVRPQKSAAGYYMGTVDGDGCPNCRLTTQYSKDKNGAYQLPLDRQAATENRFCNRTGKCDLKDKFNNEK